MEGTERAQFVLSCVNRIVYQSCRVLWTWKGLSEPSLFTFVLTGLFTSLVELLWTWKGLSEPSLFTLVLTGLFTSLCRVHWTLKGLSEPSLFTLVLTGNYAENVITPKYD